MMQPGADSLTESTRFVLGTTRLGDPTIGEAQRVRVACAALRRGLWFHVSAQYGDALEILRQAMRRSGQAAPPRVIAKLGWKNPDEVRAGLDDLARSLGTAHIEIAQLCLDGDLAADFAAGGESCEALARLRSDGRVGRFVLQVFPWTSEVACAALRRGHAERIVDGFIFYLNPLQRFASNELWELLRERRSPILAMRTLAGGDVRRSATEAGFARPYLRRRAREVLPIFERSGISSWVEFCIRYAHSLPGVVATVGSTARSEGLAALVRANRPPVAPLAREIVDEISHMQFDWALREDVLGVPGSM